MANLKRQCIFAGDIQPQRNKLWKFPILMWIGCLLETRYSQIMILGFLHDIKWPKAVDSLM